MKKVFICFIIVSLCFMYNSRADGPAKKLGRGLANTLTGCLDVPFSIKENAEKHGYIAGALYGLPIGIVKASIRTAVGVYELITFALPFPKDFEPILEPEFVWESPFEHMRAEEIE